MNGGSIFIGSCWSNLKSWPLKPLYLYCLQASLFLQLLTDSNADLSISFRCPKTPELYGSSVFRPHRRASRLHPPIDLYLCFICINLVFFFLSGSVKSQKNSTNTATTGTFIRCVFSVANNLASFMPLLSFGCAFSIPVTLTSVCWSRPP